MIFEDGKKGRTSLLIFLYWRELQEPNKSKKFAMSDPTSQNVIEIDSEKEQNNSKKTESLPNRPLPPSLMNLKFNESMFPKLASLLKRGPTPLQKQKTIEVIEVNSPPNPASVPPENSITPIKQDRIQKQASELTRIGHNHPTITVVEDLKGIPLLERLPSYLLKTRKQDYTLEQKSNKNVAPSAGNVSQQKSKEIEIKETMAEPNSNKVNLQSESLDEARETAIYRQIMELTAKILPKSPEPQLKDVNFNKQSSPCQNVNNVGEVGRQLVSPEEPESMQVQRPCSEAQSSVFASQLLAVQAIISNKADPDIPIESEKPHALEIESARKVSTINEAIPLPSQAMSNQPLQPSNNVIALPYYEQMAQMNVEPAKEIPIICQEEPAACQKLIQLDIEDNNGNIAVHQQQAQASNNALLETKNSEANTEKQRSKLTQQQVQLFKLKISHFIPDLQGYVKDAKSEEMFEIYKMIKKDMQIDLLQIELPAKLSQDISKQPSQITPAQTAQVISMQQQNTHQPIQEAQPINQNMQNNQQNLEPRHQYQQDTVAQFQLLKEAEEGQLRRKLIEYFPEAKDVLQEMAVAELKKMVQETLDEMNRNKRKQPQKDKQPQPKEPLEQITTSRKGKDEQMIEQIAEVASKPIVTLQTAKSHDNQKPVQIQQEVAKDSLEHINIQVSTIPLGQQHSKITQNKPNTQTDNISQNSPSKAVSEMRIALEKKLPDMSAEIGKLKDSNVKLIATNHAQQICIDLEEPDQPVARQVESLPLKPQQPTIQFIINQCIKMFPDVAKDIKNLSEDKIRSIYQEMIIKAGLQVSNNKNQPKESQPQLEKKIIKSNEGSDKGSANDSGKKIAESKGSNEKSLKRTYDDMMSTNPKKEDEKASEKKDIKKKFSIAQIRKILITKLPQLKSNIMMLDDSQIQAIFYEGIGSGKSQTPTQSNPSSHHQSKAPQVAKNILPQPEQKSSIQPAATILPDKHRKDSSNVQVFQSFDERKQRKVRTVVLVQSELQCVQKDGQAVSKMLVTENGVVKKCNCECCKKLDVTQLLRRLGELLDSPQK